MRSAPSRRLLALRCRLAPLAKAIAVVVGVLALVGLGLHVIGEIFA